MELLFPYTYSEFEKWIKKHTQKKTAIKSDISIEHFLRKKNM
tara:strand:+ start:449 stop:574 length:126 start_codon:yes stop_codon:yes gene_type:complete